MELEDFDFFRVGSIHIKIQTCEHFIGIAYDFAFSKTPSRGGEEDRSYSRGKMTLGQLVNALKRKVKVHSALEDLLARFVSNRNYFAHNISSVPGVNFDTSEGLASFRLFLTALDQDADVVLNVFVAVVARWQLEKYPDLAIDQETESVICKATSHHGGLLERYFTFLDKEENPSAQVIKKRKKRKKRNKRKAG